MASTGRPFRVLGVQQVAIGGLDKRALRRFWCDLLGVPAVSAYTSEAQNVDEDVLVLGRGPTAVELDLMQPIDPERPPRVHVPALNHVGLWVDDLRAAVGWLEAQGLRFTPGGIQVGAAGHEVAFLHPKSAEGVLVELVQAPPDVIAALG